MTKYAVIVFSSTFGAIRAQKALEDAVPFQVMPVLREISAGCGISLRLAPADVDAARALLMVTELSLDEYAFYRVPGSGSPVPL